MEPLFSTAASVLGSINALRKMSILDYPFVLSLLGGFLGAGVAVGLVASETGWNSLH